MCGIIGYTGNKNAVGIITNGLEKLEYRGYDSAGFAVFSDKNLITVKTDGRVSKLKEKATDLINRDIFCGIGHTRWATHGKPDETNCHPHGTENVMIVHNGIIENYRELKKFFPKESFRSETDTEVVAKLIDREYNKTKDPLHAIRNATKLLRGSYALAILFTAIPDTVFAIKHDNPILIGLGRGENYIASDTAAFAEHTDSFIRPDDNETAVITPFSVNIFDKNGVSVKHNKLKIITDKKNPPEEIYEHHMLREIHEIPEKMKLTADSLVKSISLPDKTDKNSRSINIPTAIHIIGCGTALHAGLTGKYFIEKLAGISVKTESASEFRYGNTVISENDAAIVISQSGETADTLAALRMLKNKGIKTVAIVNSQESSIATEANYAIIPPAGKEIAVASTKAFSVQCQVLLFIAVKLALEEKKLSQQQAETILNNHADSYNRFIPTMLDKISIYINAADYLKNKKTAFFIGRGIDNILGKEGALKLKEISYIHCESLPAGEFKHGTISLIEKGTPVIAIATEKKLFEKMRSNILEVKARGAFVIAVCPDTADIITSISDLCISIPDENSFSAPFTATVALQLLAYYTALAMGRDIDKPRNLAKSVTVE